MQSKQTSDITYSDITHTLRPRPNTEQYRRPDATYTDSNHSVLTAMFVPYQVNEIIPNYKSCTTHPVFTWYRAVITSYIILPTWISYPRLWRLHFKWISTYWMASLWILTPAKHNWHTSDWHGTAEVHTKEWSVCNTRVGISGRIIVNCIARWIVGIVRCPSRLIQGQVFLAERPWEDNT